MPCSLTPLWCTAVATVGFSVVPSVAAQSGAAGYELHPIYAGPCATCDRSSWITIYPLNIQPVRFMTSGPSGEWEVTCSFVLFPDGAVRAVELGGGHFRRAEPVRVPPDLRPCPLDSAQATDLEGAIGYE